MSWWGGSRSKAPSRRSSSSSDPPPPTTAPPMHQPKPTTPPGPIPVPNGSSVPESGGSQRSKWGAGVSPKSSAAMDKLEGLSEQLETLEAQVVAIRALLGGDQVTRAQVLEAKDEIAQLNGTLERIQYTGVDSVVTAELDTGREIAKMRRKSLNRRCDMLREKVTESSGVVTQLLQAP